MTFIAARESERRRTITDGQGTGAVRGLLTGGTLYTRSESAQEAGRPFDAQFRDVLRRLGGTLEDAGLTWAQVAHMQVYLADLADLPSLDRLGFGKGSRARARLACRRTVGPGEDLTCALASHYGNLRNRYAAYRNHAIR